MRKDIGKIIILGAGPTGLGAAYRLKELGYDDFIVLERENHIGGLSASFEDRKGFTWDIGGHIQFSHYRYFDRVMEKCLNREDWLQHKRDSWIWMKKRFIPYPFQNNIRYLPNEDTWKCIKGLIEASKKGMRGGKVRNFREWMFHVFGKGIAEEFMVPYNRKVWAHPLGQMSYRWIGDRVSVVDLNKVVEKVVMGKDDIQWGPNSTFKFPIKGGTGAIWKNTGELIGENKFRTRSEVRRVDPVKKELFLAGNKKIDYDVLLNTGPLDKFAGMVDNFPPALRKKAKTLKYSSVNVVGIGLKGKPRDELKKKCWMYFPESDCPFYRVTVFSNYSPNNVPDSKLYWSLMAETSESKYKPVSKDRIVKDTIDGFKATGLIENKSGIVSKWSYRASYAYPVPSLERDGILKDVILRLEKSELYSRGRFGGWKYEMGNQDHSFMQGVEWVDRVVSGKKEKTYSLK